MSEYESEIPAVEIRSTLYDKSGDYKTRRDTYTCDMPIPQLMKYFMLLQNGTNADEARTAINQQIYGTDDTDDFSGI